MQKKKKKDIRRRPPKSWVRNILKKREELGEYRHLVQEMRNNDCNNDNREYFFSIITFIFIPFSHTY